MSRIVIQDVRGWDKSDPFTLPIIGMLDSLERENLIVQNIPNRMKTVGKRSLAVGAHLDYFNFLLRPQLKKSLKEINKVIREDPNNLDYDSILELSFLIESTFKNFATINELLIKFVYEILRYLKLIQDVDIVALGKEDRIGVIKKIKDLVTQAQTEKGLAAGSWYSFIDKYRNYFTHDTALFPEYIESNELFFSIETITKEGLISLKEILEQFEKFKDMREITRQGLSEINFWKKQLKQF